MNVFNSNAPCVPLAILRASGLRRGDIQNACMKNNWTDSGINVFGIIDSLDGLGIKYKERYDLLAYNHPSGSKKSLTLAMLIKLIPTGKFVVSLNKHAIAIIDGKVLDDVHRGWGSRIVAVQEILE